MSLLVCGLELPEEMAWVVGMEVLTGYTEVERLPSSLVAKVFGEAPDKSWKFCTLDEARLMTEEWHQESDDGWFGTAPDDIEATQSVLIGELGYDRPFALDFRGAIPVVRFMMLDGRWVQIAESAEALLEALGIRPPS